MIFSKTTLGRAAVFDPHSRLSAPQRLLLRKIDGKTPLVAISQSLAPSNCSIELIDALLKQDLIRLTAEHSGDDAAGSGWPQGDRTGGFGSRAPHGGYDLTVPAQLVPPRSASQDHMSRSTERRSSAKHNIATFVLTYLPQHAESLLKGIEDIANSQQLAATLDVVSSMANRSETVNPARTKELRQNVRDLLSN